MADWRKIRAANYRSWLEGLPDEIYDKRDTSHIVRLLDVLCGDNGVGYIRKRLILKRLQTSLYETRYSDLDTVYSELFALPRLKEEQYEYHEDSLLLWSEIREMDAKDAHYRQRIWSYMLSFQYGGTVQGLALAGQAATGLLCEVVDGMVYYRSAGIDESHQYEVSGQPLNYERCIDFNGVTFLIDTDEELTAEQQYNLSSITARLRPVDVHYTFMTRKELMDDLCFNDRPDELIRPIEAEASSHWWNIVRMVTGRPDWGINVKDNEWIEANVTKEAPQQLLVNSQEATYDFTPMVSSANASSEHFGHYNASQRRIFESLGAKGAETTKGAFNALSQASSRTVVNGYYGDLPVIDKAYPVSYQSQLTGFFTEVGRSHRFWSSEERDGEESLEFELKRLVPVNRISFAIYRKPIKVAVYVSSYKDEDGNREWVKAKGVDGQDIVYVNREWGGTASAEMVAVDFDMRSIRCDAVRLTFERLNIPHYSSSWDGTYKEDAFKWSVECSDVSIKYLVRTEDDFIPTVYEDMFGNRVDTYLRTMDGEYAIDDDDDTYWISQPNVGETAVEYLILKVADKPKRVNFVELDAIYSGCQMNVYSTDRDEPGWWTPYPEIYQLQSGRTYLPMRKVTYIKLEFTMLCATPYDLEMEGVPVKTRRFPWDAKKYIDDRMSSTYELTVEQQLLLPASSALYDNGTPENIIGIEDVYIREDAIDLIDPFKAKNGQKFGWTTNYSYRMYQDNVMASIYGEDMALEEPYTSSPNATSYGEGSVAYRFSKEGEHEYEIEEFYRTQNLAYVVGLRDVKFGFSGRIFSAKQYGTFYLYMHDDSFIDVNDGWEHVRDERLKVSSDDRLNYFETVELQCIYPFRSFEMVTNQKPPTEKFSHPSDMVREWHGYQTNVNAIEMGLSGTVLAADQAEVGMGIESEPKLTRSMSIAKAQVDVYPMVSGLWEFECYDLFGESVFNLYFNLEAQKWQTVGATFVPMPGGTWWDNDYSYRVMIPIQGPVAKDACVFLPVVDIDALVDNGILDSGITKLRLVYYDGVMADEIPLEINDNMEMWFKLKQDIPSGKSANGRYDFDEREFYGAYYLYFGPSLAADEPKRDYRDVFDHGPYKMISDIAWRELSSETWGEFVLSTQDLDGSRITQNGSVFTHPRDRLEVDNEFFLPNKGFVSFEVTIDDALKKVNDLDNTVFGGTWGDLLAKTWGNLNGLNIKWGSTGEPDIRFLMDYYDSWKRMQCYTYEKQIVFVVRDKNGFESAFVSLDEDLLRPGIKSHILLEWGEPGSADITKAGFYRWGDLSAITYQMLRQREWDYIKRYPSGLQVKEVDPLDKKRRWIGVWVDSSAMRPCIPNVYDEKHYIDTDKVY